MQIDGFGNCVDQQRLGQTRYALKHEMAAGKQRDQDAFDDDILADDHLGNAAADFVDELTGPFRA